MSNLWEALDRAAEAILARVSGADNLEGGKEAETISLNDQILAFKAVSEYAIKRLEPKPREEKAKPGGRSFSKVKGSLKDAPERGSNRGKKATGETGISGTASPDNGPISILNGGAGEYHPGDFDRATTYRG